MWDIYAPSSLGCCHVIEYVIQTNPARFSSVCKLINLAPKHAQNAIIVTFLSFSYNLCSHVEDVCTTKANSLYV